MLGRLDKWVANDHVGVDSKVELIGGSGGNIDGRGRWPRIIPI